MKVGAGLSGARTPGAAPGPAECRHRPRPAPAPGLLGQPQLHAGALGQVPRRAPQHHVPGLYAGAQLHPLGDVVRQAQRHAHALHPAVLHPQHRGRLGARVHRGHGHRGHLAPERRHPALREEPGEQRLLGVGEGDVEAHLAGGRVHRGIDALDAALEGAVSIAADGEVHAGPGLQRLELRGRHRGLQPQTGGVDDGVERRARLDDVTRAGVALAHHPVEGGADAGAVHLICARAPCGPWPRRAAPRPAGARAPPAHSRAG